MPDEKNREEKLSNGNQTESNASRAHPKKLVAPESCKTTNQTAK
jgi:hypothetical protein